MTEKPTAYNIPILEVMDILYGYFGDGDTHCDITIDTDKRILLRPSGKKDDDILNQLK